MCLMLLLLVLRFNVGSLTIGSSVDALLMTFGWRAVRPTPYELKSIVVRLRIGYFLERSFDVVVIFLFPSLALFTRF